MLECEGLNLYIISCRVVEKSTKNFLVNKFLTWITNGLPMKNNYLSLCLIIRNLFQNKNRTDAEQLGRLVEYVRKNIQHLDSLPAEHVLQDGRITWLPLNEQFEEGDKEDNDWFGLTFWSSDLQAVDWISTNTTFNLFFFCQAHPIWLVSQVEFKKPCLQQWVLLENCWCGFLFHSYA